MFSTIGILYIMFIAGLELDLNEFKTHKNKSIVFGIFTFMIPLIIGYPVVHYILGYDFNSAFLTASMFATHTLVTYPIVSKLGISKNPAVAITVGGTILTDTAVMIVLAVILGNAQGSLNFQFWLSLAIGVAIFIGIMFWIVPRITRWFFEKMEREKHSHFIYVLFIVFAASFLAEIAGLEAIIGAFAAGLALNKHIPHSSPLMNRIEYIGNSLFIPFFLISVGMLVNVNVLFSGLSAWIVAGALTIVAVCGKWIAAWCTQHVFNYSGAQRQVIFGLSGAHAAATLAVIIVGFEAQILDENILNGTIVLILITSIIASISTQKAAKQIVIQSDDESMGVSRSDELHDEHILLPIARFANIEKLFELSILIKDKKSSNPISILSVVSNNDEAELNIFKARERLEKFVVEGSATETDVNIITTIDYNPVQGITRTAKEIMADFIILGWPRQAKFLDRIVGEKIDRLISYSDKNILLCSLEKQMVTQKRIVLVVPPYAEFEGGFDEWLTKVVVLAQELSIPIECYCNKTTEEAIKRVFERDNFPSLINYNEFSDWNSFLILSRYVNEEDLFILISARKGGASYMGLLDHIPHKLEKYFPKNNKIIIYPQQSHESYKTLQSGKAKDNKRDSAIKNIGNMKKRTSILFRKRKKKEDKDSTDTE